MSTQDKGHGRRETRTLTVCDAEGVDWPGCKQIGQLTREVHHVGTGKDTCEVVYVVTSLTPKEAPPKALLDLNRGHWSIENTLPYVRDVTMDEDASQVRKGSGPQVMATLRNTVISVLHRNGIHTMAAALRKLSTNVGEALGMVGIDWLSH